MRIRLFSLSPILLLPLLLGAVPALADGLIEERLELPASFDGLFGKDSIQLDALVVRPDDDRRHPLAVIIHGTPRDAAARKTVLPGAMRGQAREFARRGWTAVTFTRRGFGASGGSYAENSGLSCATAVYEPAGKASAEDVRAVIEAMKEKAYVDGGTIIAVGRSTGGFATVALAADPPEGLVAAINFAGGRGSASPDQVCNPEALIDAFASFGKTARIPMLWIYAENDHFFSLALAKRFHQAFTEHGGQAEFVAAPAFEADGHALFTRAGAPIWTPYVDAFLERWRLKLLDRPMPDDWAENVRFPDGLRPRGKIAFLDYLDSRPHKAFAVSADGHFGWRAGIAETDEAGDLAIKRCQTMTTQPCRLAAEDGEARE